MARKKAVTGSTGRPTIEELKTQPGNLYMVRCAGYGGGYSVKAPAQRLITDPKLESLMIPAWAWQPLDEAWLDSPLFKSMYSKYTDIHVQKCDELPPPHEGQVLPRVLEDALTREHKIVAWELANEDKLDKIRHVINSNANYEQTAAPRVRFMLEKLQPFLRAFKIYEQRCGNRKVVIDMIDKRLKQIEDYRKQGDTMGEES